MSAVTAIDVASYLVGLASKIDENDLTNLKLQKLLFFIQAEYYTANGKGLFDDQIEAWDYGPVIRSVYNAYKACGAFPITVFDVPSEPTKLPADIKAFVNRMWEKYGKFSAFHLVKLTHDKGGPWAKHYGTLDTIISLPEMRLHSPAKK